MKIIIIGTGNIAHQMGQRLNDNGVKINKIIGRNSKRAEELADLLDCPFSTNFDYTDKEDVTYLLAVNDQSIEEVSKKIKQKESCS